LEHTFLVLVTVGVGHGVYRKLYTLIGGQRAEKLRTTALDRLEQSWDSCEKYSLLRVHNRAARIS